MTIRQLLPADPDRVPVEPNLAVARPVPYAPPAPLPPNPDDWAMDWRRALSAVLRWKWWVVLLASIGAIGGWVVGRFKSVVYASQATIWIDGGGREEDRGNALRPRRLLDADAWLDLLRSYVVMDEVTRRERLYLGLSGRGDSAAFANFTVVGDHYRPGDYRLAVDGSGRRYALTSVDGVPLEEGSVGDSIGRRYGFSWMLPAGVLQPGSAVTFSVASVRDGAKSLQDQLDAKIDEFGNFLHLELHGTDPVRITQIVNAVADRYVAVAADLKKEKLTELTKTLETQLAEAKQTLQSAENSLEHFGVQTITLAGRGPTGGGGGDNAQARDPVVAGYFDMTVTRDQVRQDRDALQRALARGDSGLTQSALDVIGSVQKSPELAQALDELTKKEADLRAMRYRYSEEYPPLQRLVGDIAALRRQTIPTLVRSLVQELAAREGELSGRITTSSNDLRRIPPRAIEEARLRRAVTIAENLYTNVESRYQEARLAESSAIPDVKILDAAVVPRAPLQDLARRFVLVGFCAGLGLAVAGALLFDRMDPRVRYPEQVSRELGLPILGTVPHLARLRDVRKGVARGDKATDNALESLRGIRLNLSRAYGAAGPLVFGITSPGAGDGKSFLSANLALSFAAAGYPTLIVDADMRRGQLHKHLNARRRPGLAEYLRGDVGETAVIQTTAHPAVSVITCGVRTPEAPELLESSRFTDLLGMLRANYPVVIVDSPPLGAGVDAYLIGAATGHLLFVLRTGRSHRAVAETSLEMLRRLPVRLLGAVLNDVPPFPAYRYYPYATEYAMADEDEPKLIRRSGPRILT